MILDGFRTANTPEKLYWTSVSSSSFLFLYVLFRFFKDTARISIKEPTLIISLIILALGSVYIVGSSITSFFSVQINFSLVRMIFFAIYTIGSFTLLNGTSREIKRGTTPTQKSRLYLFRLTIIFIFGWILLTLIFALIQLYVEFGTLLYFALPSVISMTLGILTILVAWYYGQMLVIPEWIRRKFDISKKRFQEYQKMEQ